MTWIIISIPLMILAIAIAILPVLLMSISEARRGLELTGPQQQRPAPPADAPVNAQGYGRTAEARAQAA